MMIHKGRKYKGRLLLFPTLKRVLNGKINPFPVSIIQFIDYLNLLKH